MKKILIVILESTLLTLFFTMMSQASSNSVGAQQSCRSSLTSQQRCAQETTLEAALKVKLAGDATKSFRMTP